MPVRNRAIDGFEGEQVELPLDDEEDLLAGPVDVGSDVVAGGNDHFEGRQQRRVARRDLDGGVEVGAAGDALAVRW